MNKISDDLLIRLIKQASLGKLIGGLIHNINGLMQNLGLNIEMANLLINNPNSGPNDIIEDIKKRLTRMEEEFSRIDHLIRAVSVKADPRTDYSKSLNLNNFLEQELEFLNSNLYFKHNVQKDLRFEPDPPCAADLPENSFLALGWFLHAMIEELETREAKLLSIKTYTQDLKSEIILSTEKGGLSGEFLDQVHFCSSDQESSETNDKGITLNPALKIFEKEGISIRHGAESDRASIRMTIPLISNKS
ncbi:MAG: hypothetical protein JW882_19875 [Deltaproteobacteria bacterium]|nr:hypothetical protein [Deltaproteobacteria bacterium]